MTKNWSIKLTTVFPLRCRLEDLPSGAIANQAADLVRRQVEEHVSNLSANSLGASIWNRLPKQSRS